MANTLDHVAYLSQEIGPRPAGTEEEQQAALYITEQLQKDAGLSTVIEDFNGVSNPESTFIILSAVSAVFALASLFLSFLMIPAIVITIVAAVVTVLERFGRPVLSTVLSRGVSQNVVAQYKPAFSEDGPGLRRRKVVLVARYDSGKVRIEEGRALAGAARIVNWVALGGIVILPLFLLVRYIGFIHASGAVAVALNVVMVVLALAALIPTFLSIAHKAAAYNEAANVNAAGVAVMLDVASRIGKGRMSEAELSHREDSDSVIHGERAARAAGVVPEGAELVYEADAAAAEPADEANAVDRLVAAKAAVAALTGKPVSTTPARDISRNLVSLKDQPVGTPTEQDIHEMREEARNALSGASYVAAADEAAVPAAAKQPASEGATPAAMSEGGAATGVAAAGVAAAAATASVAARPANGGVPDWYVEAQKKAKRTAPTAGSVHRSRYADALEAAQTESSWWEAQIEQESASSALSDQIRQLQDGIKEIKAPRFDRAAAPEGVDAAVAAEAAQDVEASPAAEGASTAAPVAAAQPAPAAPEAPHEPVAFERSTTVEAAASAPAAEAARVPHDADQTLPHQPVLETAAAVQPQQQPRDAQPQQAASVPDAAAVASMVPFDGIPLFSSDDAGMLAAKAAADAEAPAVDLGATIAHMPQVAQVTEATKQRAPLAEATTSGKNAAKSLLSLLPSLSGSFDAVGSSDDGAVPRSAQPGGASKRHDRAGMRTTLPSLSGSITRQGAITPDDEPASPNSLAPANPAGSAGMTGAFAPVGEELLKEADPDDPSTLFVEDADDSVFEENYTETGAFAGPGYVDMPTSRLGGFFGRFRHRKEKKEAERRETSAQEWLDVDEDFDAREVGKARGGWESFRNEEASSDSRHDAPAPDGALREDEFDDGATTAWAPVDASAAEGGWDTWNDSGESGGSWSDDAWGSAWDEGDADDVEDERPARRSGRSRRWHGGAFSRFRRGGRAGSRAAERADGMDSSDSEATYRDSGNFVREEEQIDRELEQIYRFRNPDISTEVWFVALGSEMSSHSGMKAFLTEHASELRGAIIVELEGLGAGELSLVERGGTFRPYTASSRMSRYLTKASRDCGLSVQKVSLPWSDSATAYAMKHGVQGMHLVGVEGSKVALASEADDVMANIDEKKLAQASDFVVALLKNI